MLVRLLSERAVDDKRRLLPPHRRSLCLQSLTVVCVCVRRLLQRSSLLLFTSTVNLFQVFKQPRQVRLKKKGTVAPVTWCLAEIIPASFCLPGVRFTNVWGITMQKNNNKTNHFALNHVFFFWKGCYVTWYFVEMCNRTDTLEKHGPILKPSGLELQVAVRLGQPHFQNLGLWASSGDELLRDSHVICQYLNIFHEKTA